MLHVGALLDRAPGRKYTSALRFAEFAPRHSLPRPGTLASMRTGLPADFVFALRAPRTSLVSARGTLRMDDALEAGLHWLLAAADALQARAVVFNTPADLTPGARSRDLLREFVARLPRVANRHYVWLPQGVWEPLDTQALCADLGLVFGFDPLETKPGPGSVAYGTVRAFGHRSGFSIAALSDAIVTTLSHRPTEAFISVDAERAFDVARRIRTLSTEAGIDQPIPAGEDAELDELEEEEEEELDDDDSEDADDEGDDEDAPAES